MLSLGPARSAAFYPHVMTHQWNVALSYSDVTMDVPPPPFQARCFLMMSPDKGSREGMAWIVCFERLGASQYVVSSTFLTVLVTSVIIGKTSKPALSAEPMERLSSHRRCAHASTVRPPPPPPQDHLFSAYRALSSC